VLATSLVPEAGVALAWATEVSRMHSSQQCCISGVYGAPTIIVVIV
jgi:hypothetical protein